MSKTLLIMAAGMGSRFGGIKQIEPVGSNDELIIDYSIYDAKRVGFNKVVFVIRREIEKDFCERIFNRIKTQIDAQYVFQDMDDLPGKFKMSIARTKPWGTTQAVLAARHVIKEPFCVVSSDDLYGPEAFEKIGAFLDNVEWGDKNKYGMVCYKIGNTLSEIGAENRGVPIADENGMLVELEEKFNVEKKGDKIGYMKDGKYHKIDPNTEVSMSFWGFTPDIFKHMEREFAKFLKKNINTEKAESIIPTVVGNLIKDKKVSVKILSGNGNCYGITYRENIARIQAELNELTQAGFYTTPLWNVRVVEEPLLTSHRR